MEESVSSSPTFVVLYFWLMGHDSDPAKYSLVSSFSSFSTASSPFSYPQYSSSLIVADIRNLKYLGLRAI